MKIKVLVVLMALVCVPLITDAKKREKKKKAGKTENVQTPKESAYDQLFKGKECTTVKGMITLHKVDGKLYFEFPLSLLGRDMLLGSTVSSISDNSNALVGQKNQTPLHVAFTMTDSMVYLREVTNPSRAQISSQSKDKHIEQAMEMGTRLPIMEGFAVKAYNADSTAVVFEATKFFVSDDSRMDPFDPYGKKVYYGQGTRRKRFQSELSYVGDIKAFSDNVSITSSLSYLQDIALHGMFVLVIDEPVTVGVNRSLVLLPEEPRMRPRLADPRIGYFVSGKEVITDDLDGVKDVYYINRWDLQPKDVEAYKRGELVEPVKPIVYYVDDAFPNEWKTAIHAGIRLWNKAFEKIGFKNAVQSYDFPKDDPEFDPDNIKYSCVRYCPVGMANAQGPSWVDPRNSEVVNASVLIYHDVIKLINNMRFVQTAQVDERVRTTKLPEDVLFESMRYIVAHEVGHTLGLMHNMAASASIPVESYRDAEFMEKYGTTPSIMDYARFNYIAQPEDKGVSLTPPELGVYDYYAIEWGYKPLLDARTPEEELPVLRKMISDKIGDPMFRYGKQQIGYGTFDPSSLTEDLSNDAVKAGEYGIKNLKYILKNLNHWMDSQDKDYTYRDNIYREICNQYSQYIYTALANVGGFYINEHFVGDPYKTYQVVPKEIQKRALRFAINELKNMEWLDCPEVVKNLEFDGSNARLLLKAFASSLVSTKRLALGVYRDPNGYSPQEYLDDLYNMIWASTLCGKNPTEAERILQTEVVNSLISGVNPAAGRKSMADMVLAKSRPAFGCACGGHQQLPDYQIREIMEKLPMRKAISMKATNFDQFSNLVERRQDLHDRLGYDFIQYVANISNDNNQHLLHQMILKIQNLMKVNKNNGSYETRGHYAYLLSQIEGFLKNK